MNNIPPAAPLHQSYPRPLAVQEFDEEIPIKQEYDEEIPVGLELQPLQRKLPNDLDHMKRSYNLDLRSILSPENATASNLRLNPIFCAETVNKVKNLLSGKKNIEITFNNNWNKEKYHMILDTLLELTDIRRLYLYINREVYHNKRERLSITNKIKEILNNNKELNTVSLLLPNSFLDNNMIEGLADALANKRDILFGIVDYGKSDNNGYENISQINEYLYDRRARIAFRQFNNSESLSIQKIRINRMIKLGATELLIENNSDVNNSTNHNVEALLETLPKSSIGNIFCSADELSEERVEYLNNLNQINKERERINFYIQDRQQRAQPVNMILA